MYMLLLGELICCNSGEEILGFDKVLPAACQKICKKSEVTVFSDRELMLSTIFLIKCYWNNLTVPRALKLVLCFIFK